MRSFVKVAAIGAAAFLAGAATAQTGPMVNPSLIQPGSRAGDAPGMGSIGSQFEGGIVGQGAPRHAGTAAPGPINPGSPGASMQPAQPPAPTGAASPGPMPAPPGVPPGAAPAAAGGTTPRPTLTEAQARTQLSGAGYGDVRELAGDGQGGWRGRAMRDGRLIAVAVDPQGQVTAAQ